MPLRDGSVDELGLEAGCEPVKAIGKKEGEDDDKKPNQTNKQNPLIPHTNTYMELK